MLDFYWILKLGDNVKVKKYSTSYQKLMKFFNLWSITKQLFFSFLKVYFFRYLEIRVKKVTIDLDRFNHEQSPERQKLQKYLEKKRPRTANVKYFAYFCPEHRKNVIGFELTEVQVKFKFHQSELFHIEMESSKGHLFMTSPITNKKIGIAEGNKMTLNIHFPLKLNKSLAYLQTEICFDFYGIDFTITH